LTEERLGRADRRSQNQADQGNQGGKDHVHYSSSKSHCIPCATSHRL
jgi:hypothetical protein